MYSVSPHHFTKYLVPSGCIALSVCFSDQSITDMKMMNVKLLKACQKKWRNVGSRSVPPDAACGGCCLWNILPMMHQDNSIPRDVPKGHLVVYVGDDHRRHVIQITLLEHPLFKALLDLAQDAYGFADSKLWIPCDENVFLNVIRCASLRDDRRFSLCL